MTVSFSSHPYDGSNSRSLSINNRAPYQQKKEEKTAQGDEENEDKNKNKKNKKNKNYC